MNALKRTSCARWVCGPLFILSVALAPAAAWAQTLTTLYTFTGGSDGSDPRSGLIADAAGNLYGTTLAGGAYGFGTVFKVTPGGAKSVLYSFAGGGDGAFPIAGLVADGSGNLYGTTEFGGGGCTDFSGCGTVFKVTPSGAETVLYRFTGGDDGGEPGGDLIIDVSGNLYGTTSAGGAVHHCFNGIFFGGCGTVFKVTPGGAETVLHSFTASDGAVPLGALLGDASGNLYGTTSGGGDGTSDTALAPATVFKLASSGVLTTLAFIESSNSSLIADASGNLYGTATGHLDDCVNASDCGYVFQLTPAGALNVLHSFTGGSDGALPFGRLVVDASGNLYGATGAGGGGPCFYSGKINVSGCGSLFKVTPGGAETVLYSFTGGSDGGVPPGSLIADASGTLYGTTSGIGPHQVGTVFKFTLARTFDGTPGQRNCSGQSLSTLAQKYGGIAHAAIALGYANVTALQNAVAVYCGSK